MPIHAQLVFLVQDGQPFGLKGKRLPSLSLAFQSGAPNNKSAKGNSSLIPSDLGPLQKVSEASKTSSISGKEMLYAEVAAPTKGERSFRLGTEDNLLESSKNGGVALAVIVEWKQ
jgi:hypothetical protein